MELTFVKRVKLEKGKGHINQQGKYKQEQRVYGIAEVTLLVGRTS
jgi:hypothetical protein